MAEPKWTEELVASCLVTAPFMAAKPIVIPNCHWGGHEKDLLVIDQKSFRLIDIEIKVSRADLKADAKKDKWRRWSRKRYPSPWVRHEWPDKAWKHYYALPASIWTDELAQYIPDPSGVILVHWDARYRDDARLQLWRRAIPQKGVKGISPADCLDLARLSTLRYWALIRKNAVYLRAPNQPGTQP